MINSKRSSPDPAGSLETGPVSEPELEHGQGELAQSEVPGETDLPVESRAPSAPPSAPAGIPIKEGDLVMLLTEDNKRLTVKAGKGTKGTHFGDVDLEGMVGKSYGHATYTNIGHPIYLLRLTLQDHIMSLKRITQIIYPKDLGTILMKLGIGQGSRVIECGTGSGALTMAMAWMAGPTGRIYSYDREPSFSKRARYNLTRAGLIDRVELKVRDLNEGDFDEQSVDAAFLDVREPPEILDKVTARLSPGGVLGFLLPTANQVSDLLVVLQNAPYIDIEVMETFFRKYKVNAERFRPEDRMIGHTGYLIFARRIVPVPDFIPAHRPKAVQMNRPLRKQVPENTVSGIPGARDNEADIDNTGATDAGVSRENEALSDNGGAASTPASPAPAEGEATRQSEGRTTGEVKRQPGRSLPDGAPTPVSEQPEPPGQAAPAVTEEA